MTPEDVDDVDSVDPEVLHVTNERSVIAVVTGADLQVIDIERVTFASYVR